LIVKIAILGGSGKLGLALAARLRQSGHSVMIGSRDEARAAESRKADVMDLIRSMKLNPVNAGPIEAAGHIERLTALQLSINKANKAKESGIKITGI
jgi:predicted dinucleotide-binding enzyme